ncbi:MAG TPA: hypothetical protein VG602_03220 [Actinomycetota bacterium]|nr:hypothetical protein [Actinomycetota bacterium]
MAENDRLEALLRDVGRRLAVPQAPGVASSVTERLSADHGPSLRRPPRRTLALAAAAVLAVAGVASATGLLVRGVDIRRVPTVRPTAPPEERPDMQLGRRATLAQAGERLGFAVPVPQIPGPPDDVFIGREPPGGRITLMYEARPGIPRDPVTGKGMLISMFRGQTERDFVTKELGPDTSLRYVAVRGAPGFWIEGEPHTVYYLDDRGQLFPDSVRLAGNVLLWQRGELTLRLESRLPLEDALAVAESMP